MEPLPYIPLGNDNGVYDLLFMTGKQDMYLTCDVKPPCDYKTRTRTQRKLNNRRNK
jgi:hypothetical protein